MQKKLSTRVRLLFLGFFALGIFIVYGLLLMTYQVVHGAEYRAQMNRTTVTRITIDAARGNILDRNGVLLATNEIGLNVVFYYSSLQSGSENEIIAGLITLFEEKGEEYTDLLPLSDDGTSFLPDTEKEVETLKSALGLNVYATAENCLYHLIEQYDIDGYDTEMARKIAGVRYSMYQSDFSVNNNVYRFAQDISYDLALTLKELSYRFPGVEIEETDLRIYPEGDTAPHLVGTIGAMSAEEYADTYKDAGYPMNAYVGKFGIEKEYESILHGEEGILAVERNAKTGEILSEVVTEAPQAGSDVVLTIDSVYQQKLQEILDNHLAALREEQEGEDGNHAEGGAIVVLDARNGDVLAMVTSPSYDINDFFTEYDTISTAEYNPLTNRAISGLYRPGSTFKTVVAAAGLSENIITPTQTVYCAHVYTYYDYIPGNTFHPTCLGTHGNIAVSDALTVSCNIFFYEVGRLLGIDTINRYANAFGLGVDTGLELYSHPGYLSSPERSEELGTEWFQGNVVQASIGQMDTAVTPLQLAVQAMTLANKGSRYQAHLVKEIQYQDETVSQTTPQVLSEISLSDENYQAILNGMIGAANRVTGEYALTNLGYAVALKTGTPQVTTETYNSVAIGFAPADNPVLAFGIVLEEGEYANQLVRQILDAYTDLYGNF